MSKIIYNSKEYTGSNYPPEKNVLKYYEENFSSVTVISGNHVALPANSSRPKNALFVTISHWGENTDTFNVGMSCAGDGTTNLYLIGKNGTNVTYLRIRTWYYEQREVE